jgi:uncharacterized Zn-finger protein
VYQCVPALVRPWFLSFSSFSPPPSRSRSSALSAVLSRCCSGGGATGHPTVFMKLDVDTPVPCDYCGLRYIRRDAAEKNGIPTQEVE